VVERRYLSAPAVAERLGVNLSKVIGWIGRGELRAVNVADRTGPGCRPRWRIAVEDLERFEAARAAVPMPAADQRRPRRSKRQGYVEYV